VLWIVDVFREYCIEVELVPEHYTSKECLECGDVHENGRIYRGLYVCRRNRRKINADVNAAINIARKQEYKVKITRKIESYLVTHNGVKPLTPIGGLTPKTQRFETPPFKGGEGSRITLL